MTRSNGDVQDPVEGALTVENAEPQELVQGDSPVVEALADDAGEVVEAGAEGAARSGRERRGRRGRGRRGRSDRAPEGATAPAAPASDLDDDGEVNGNVAGLDSGGESGSDQPMWQRFGVPPSYWETNSYGGQGQSRGRTSGAEPRPGRGAPRGGAARKGGGARPARTLECRLCGVKIERRAAHGRGRVACPTCGKWMQEKG